MTPLEQQLAALDLANAVRYARADERRRICGLPPVDGRRELARLLLDPPRHLEGVLAGTVLTWPSRYGTGKAHLALRWAGASAHVPVGRLVPRQRRVLAGLLASNEPASQWWKVDIEAAVYGLEKEGER